MIVTFAVVSHGHGVLIKELNCLSELNANFNVVVKNNKEDEALVHYCNDNNIKLFDQDYGLGFGENNNYIFERLEGKYRHDDAIFIVINPDVYIDNNNVHKLLDYINSSEYCLFGINLFKDENYNIYDNSVRKFPSVKDFFQSFFFKKNNSVIDKGLITSPTLVDWVAGSFIAFKSQHYNRLNGFDSTYFMYCEDIDICFRSNKNYLEMVCYLPFVKAKHLAQHDSRNALSKHMFWHLKSVFIFLITKYGIRRKKNQL